MIVKQAADGKWAVLDGVKDGFATHGEAYRWLERQERRATRARRDTADWRGHGVYYDAGDSS
jgi:hypothetical protein